ncbi:MAG: hypothetical protein ACU84H_03460 [Gammaproteobacteria bacterium]
MNTRTIKKSKMLIIGMVALIVGLLPISSGASDDAKVIYQSQSTHHNIYSYPGSTKEEVSLKPELIYVSQAYGPAIHSYAHTGSEKVVPWNVEYVDTAYGQAIYSYERRQVDGDVKVLPLLMN